MYIPNVWWWLPRGEIAEDSVTRPQPTSCLHCKYWGAPRHVMGGKRVLRKFIIFSRYHSSKSNFPWSAPLLQLFCLFICLFVYFLLLVQLFANLHGTPPWGGMGRGAREQFKGRSLVYDDIWVQKKKFSNRVLAPSPLSYPMQHAWDLAPNRDDRLFMRQCVLSSGRFQLLFSALFSCLLSWVFLLREADMQEQY